MGIMDFFSAQPPPLDDRMTEALSPLFAEHVVGDREYKAGLTKVAKEQYELLSVLFSDEELINLVPCFCHRSYEGLVVLTSRRVMEFKGKIRAEMTLDHVAAVEMGVHPGGFIILEVIGRNYVPYSSGMSNRALDELTKNHIQVNITGVEIARHFTALLNGQRQRGLHTAATPPVHEFTMPGQLPNDVDLIMEQYGRYIFNPLRSNFEPDNIWASVASLYPLAQADPDAFVTALSERFLPAGDWSLYGAARMVTELLETGFKHPAHDALLTASLQFLRERGVPNLMLTEYEWRYWVDTQGKTEPWLVGRSKPTPEQAPITDLAVGEVRRIAQVFPEADSNIILVRRHEEGGYVSVIDAKWSDDNPTRSQGDWERADTLNELYWKLGCSFQVPTYWYHEELEPYFPLPEPRLE